MKPQSRRPLPDRPELLESLRKRVKEVHSFWRTRRAIRDGKPLYDYTKTDLESNGFMGPWTFNLAESVFAAIPALAVSKVLSFLYPSPEITPLLSADATFGQKLLDTTLALFDSVFSWLQPFLIPVWLLLMARVFAWASLKKADASAEAKRRAMYAYLYLDGAYGLLPQCILVFGLIVGLTCTTNSIPVKWPIGVGLFLAFFVGVWWGLLLTGKTIPRQLFKINGYSDKVPHLWQRWQRRSGANYGPWTKYEMTLLFGAPAVAWTLLLLVIVLAILVAVVLAALKLALVG